MKYLKKKKKGREYIAKKFCEQSVQSLVKKVVAEFLFLEGKAFEIEAQSLPVLLSSILLTAIIYVLTIGCSRGETSIM